MFLSFPFQIGAQICISDARTGHLSLMDDVNDVHLGPILSETQGATVPSVLFHGPLLMLL